MIREIINFTNSLNPEIFNWNLNPSEGLHILVTLNNQDNYTTETEIYRKNSVVSNFLRECIKLECQSEFITMNKAFDSSKKIHSCSPFVISFKKVNPTTKKENIDDAITSIDNYFSKSLSINSTILEENDILIVNQFKEICKSKIISGLKESENYKDLKKSDYINIYLKNIDFNKYEKSYKEYLRKNLYNKDDYNYPKNTFDYGLSDFLNGDNVKKEFLNHRTSTFDISGRISGEDASILFKFQRLLTNRTIPQPFPIFIDERELNNRVIEIFNKEGERKIAYTEILKKLYEDRNNDLSNYYLLFFSGGKVKDFDFVSKFRYKIENMKIYDLFSQGNNVRYEINNVFDFERKIIRSLFNNQLVQISQDNKVILKYFDDIKYNPKYIDRSIYDMILKYRKSIYDYIYKSRTQSIQGYMFKEIIMTGIIQDIKDDEYKNNKHSKEYSIKEKLNIFLGINHHFDPENKNFNQINKKGEFMPSRIKEFQERIKIILENENEHFNNDEEFCYGSGQLIYYLLYQSEAGNKSHAMLEPFIQKVDSKLLLNSITSIIDRYKHNLRFGHRKFNKLASEILGYQTEINLKLLTPFLLAGYFSNCLLFPDKKEKENSNQLIKEN